MFAFIRASVADVVGLVRSVFEWRRLPLVEARVSAFDEQFASVEGARRWTAGEWAEDLGVDFWSAA